MFHRVQSISSLSLCIVFYIVYHSSLPRSFGFVLIFTFYVTLLFVQPWRSDTYSKTKLYLRFPTQVFQTNMSGVRFAIVDKTIFTAVAVLQSFIYHTYPAIDLFTMVK